MPEPSLKSPSAPGTGCELSRDSLFQGRIVFWQPCHGYRVNVDTLLLAAFAARGRRCKVALDLGCGIGALSLVLHYLGGARSFLLVEKDSELLEIAEQNLRQAGAPTQSVVGDLAEHGLPAEFRQQAELVMANPPFFDLERHRPAHHPGIKSARTGRIAPFVAAAAGALAGCRARAVFVYPAFELQDLVRAAETEKLVLKRLRLVHARASAPARVALVEMRRARPGGLIIEPPLFEWSADGTRSPELNSLLEHPGCDRK